MRRLFLQQSDGVPDGSERRQYSSQSEMAMHDTWAGAAKASEQASSWITRRESVLAPQHDAPSKCRHASTNEETS